MQELSFITTLKCDGCVAKVKDALDAAPGIESWETRQQGPGKQLLVRGAQPDPEAILGILTRFGYKGELQKG